MTLSSVFPLNPLLQQQADKSWLTWVEVNNPLVKQLTLEQQKLLQKAMGLSDFVATSLLQQSELALAIFVSGDTKLINTDYSAMLMELLADCASEAQLFKFLRQFRRKEMMIIAINDMCFNAEVTESLARLSELADSLILATRDWLMKFNEQGWGLPCNKEGKVQPLLIYGMGKLGGRELNFSSDIDLIFAYPERGETQGGRRTFDNQEYFIRIGQKLINALNQQTVDGFVYRVDMRLRPFGDSGPLVLSFSALEDYYQEQGRDWERYAMLKARLIGQGEYHKQLTQMLRPFVYRRYIDFSVIDSLRRMKQLISQEVRRRQLNDNIKLGAGGIREIEFIVQVFQLIRGGRIVELQERSLLIALPLLVTHGELTQQQADSLTNAYFFLRRAENIIQAINDEQTQQLPELPLDRERLIVIMGFDTWQTFHQACLQVMQDVHQIFSGVIGDDLPNQLVADQHWVALWQQHLSLAEACQLIAERQPEWPSETIYHSLIDFKNIIDKRPLGSRGQTVLDKLMPQLLEHLVNIDDVAITFARVMQVFAKICTRTAYLELLYENSGALNQLIKLCSASSWIAEHIAKYPVLLDDLISPNLLIDIPALSDYSVQLRELLLRVPEDDLEQQMEVLRQFKQSRQLQIAGADVSNLLPIMKVSDHLTALAESLIEHVIQLAWHQMVVRYGQPSATLNRTEHDFAVIGYGKCGGIELSYSSDLDLVFVHCAKTDDFTTGEKSIPASQFYLKMAQRIIHIFNTKTANGILYDVDMRLRPSGNSGLMVVHIDTFASYQKEEAWTWEHQALVRARMVYGQTSLITSFDNIRHAILSQKRDNAQLCQDVASMREKMRNHLDKSAQQLVDVKQSAGGLADIEFLAQYFMLNFSHTYPALTHKTDNYRIFELLATHQIITDQEAEQLINAYLLLRAKTHSLALQNLPTVIDDKELVEERGYVVSIWQKYMKNC